MRGSADAGHQTVGLDHDPLDLVERHLIHPSVAEPPRPRAFVIGHLLRYLELAAVAQVLGDAGGAERVAPRRGRGSSRPWRGGRSFGRRRLGASGSSTAQLSVPLPSGTAALSRRPQARSPAGRRGGTRRGCGGRASRAPCRPSRGGGSRCGAPGRRRPRRAWRGRADASEAVDHEAPQRPVAQADRRRDFDCV